MLNFLNNINLCLLEQYLIDLKSVLLNIVQQSMILCFLVVLVVKLLYKNKIIVSKFPLDRLSSSFLLYDNLYSTKIIIKNPKLLTNNYEKKKKTKKHEKTALSI